MLDFFEIWTRNPKKGVIEVYPEFQVVKSKDLMIRGKDFYAIWDEERNLWSTDESDAIRLIDNEIINFVKEKRAAGSEFTYKALLMKHSSSGIIDQFHKYCQRQMFNNYHMLDEKVIFSNQKIKRSDYASKCLAYPLEEGPIDAWDSLLSVLYSPSERHKIEWAIGSIIEGDSKKIQKFLVFYGSAGTGKSTVLDIIQELFSGYWIAFEAKAIGSSNNSFALEPFSVNPLLAIDHEGELSKIEDNSRLNGLVSHDTMLVNPKNKAAFPMQFKCMLFIATNKPVKITDAKSGLLRRLIDITPTGEKIPGKEYRRLKSQVIFELGAIANHCKKVYLSDPHLYDTYVPTSMLSSTNDFYNFVEENFLYFKEQDGVTLKQSWEMYKTYCDYAKVPYPYSYRIFREEMKNYFKDFKERCTDEDGNRLRSYYSGFKVDKFEHIHEKEEETPNSTWIELKEQDSILDGILSACRAQYAGKDGKPTKTWDSISTKLKDIRTSKVHYVMPQDYNPNIICLDFDKKNENGEKDLELNIQAASIFPETYTEVSQGGNGLHLYYIWDGCDVRDLATIFGDDIEIKRFTGNASLRRRVSLCNRIDVRCINSGLPLDIKKKERKNMVDYKFKDVNKLRERIIEEMHKKTHGYTKPSIDFIKHILDEAYDSGLTYDLSDMHGAMIKFAQTSTNQKKECLKVVSQMKFMSDDAKGLNDLRDDLPINVLNDDGPIVFYDIEVYPNLLLIVAKELDAPKEEAKIMFNPPASFIEWLIKQRLVGHNCRRYDNHITYAAYMGYNNDQIYKLSKKIISNEGNPFFGEGWDFSYADTYDYPVLKQSLKKWEIQLGMPHMEMDIPWDQPVDKKLWPKIAEYCLNDVLATEAVWKATRADFAAREILADITGGKVNDTTNMLTTKMIFGNNRHPQDQFNYRNLAEPVFKISRAMKEFLEEKFPEMMATKHGAEKSILPYFPGYEYKDGKSTYRGEEVGEGGYVYAEPNMYIGKIDLFDVTSMHPHSAMLEVLFGEDFTRRFYDLVYARVGIKHESWDIVSKMLGGVLKPYIEKVKSGEISKDDLATALKIAINSVYGLTAAGFSNPFKDPRNIDNIVAKRGALFMIDLKRAVQEKGYTVAHIKTDSIKVVNGDEEIKKFIMDFGKKYGYTFEHEATYDRMCLVNDAVYIARYADGKHKGEWTATGTQFAVPYVFKKIFSKEKIEFDDLCETKSVSTSIYLDMNEKLPNVEQVEKDLAKYAKDLKDKKIEPELYEKLKESCEKDIAKGHDYKFVGKVGRFCPIKEGYGGGLLKREKDGKYYAVTGSSGFRWLEATEVKERKMVSAIDEGYYISLVDDAINTMAKYGDVDEFLGYHFENSYPCFDVIPDGVDEELPFV